MEEDQKYKELITQFLEKELTDDELTLLTNWINESSENKKEFDHYNELWQMSQIVLNEAVFNTDAGWNSLKNELHKGEDKGAKPLRLITARHLLLLRIASAAAVVVALLFTGLFFSKTMTTSKNQVVTIQSPRGEKSRVILADGTIVWLNSESQLTWSNDFDSNKRQVTLEGEGYFDVKKDNNRPFIVRTAHADIKVTGTRFNVCAYPEEQLTEATLEEGKIGVFISGRSNPVPVNPGQRLVFDKQSREITLVNVNTDLYTSWKENKLRFDNARFGDVVKKLERWYDVKIILDKNLKYSERYTMTIKTESLREVLNRLKITTPMSYNIKEEYVFIYPNN